MHFRRPSTSRHTTPLAKACNLSTHAPQQPNKPLLCPAAGVSESQYDVSPTVRHLQALPLCHRSKLKPKLCSCRCLAQPHFAFALSGFVEQLLQAPGLCCFVHFQHTLLNDLLPLKVEPSFNLNECHHTCAAIADQATDALTENDQGKHRSKPRLKCATATAMHMRQSNGSQLGSHTQLRSGPNRSRALKGIAYIYARLPKYFDSHGRCSAVTTFLWEYHSSHRLNNLTVGHGVSRNGKTRHRHRTDKAGIHGALGWQQQRWSQCVGN